MEVEQNLPVVEHAISEGVECQPGEEKKNILLDVREGFNKKKL